MTATTKIVVERDNQEIEVTVTLEYSYDSGEYLEPGHATNGYGAGYEVDDILEVSPEIELTNEEELEALENILR